MIIISSKNLLNNRKKICLFYFSGTGNTAWAVNVLKDNLEKFDFEVTVHSCETKLDINTYIECSDIVGLAFPIYASFAPALFQEFFSKLPRSKNKPLIALCTAGFIAGDVLHYTLNPLKNKGYIPMVFCNIIVANNMHLPRLSPLRVTSAKKLPKKLDKATKKIESMVYYTQKGMLHIEGINPIGRIFGILQRSISGSFESMVFKGFYVDDTCIHCGWCVDNCPNSNIKLSSEGVRFLDNCMLCLRCYNFCPKHSIQMSEKTKNIHKYKRYKGIPRNY